MALVQTITVDPTKVPSDQGSDLSSAGIPLFYDLSNAGSDFWGTVANGGGDIRVFENDGVTELPREVVSCDTATETGELHFLADHVDSVSDTVFQIHADGVSSDYAADATYGSEAVWVDYEVVAHLTESPSTTSGGYVNSAGNSDGTGVSMAVANAAGPLSGDVAQFASSGDYITWPINWNSATAFTAQAWGNPANLTVDQRLVGFDSAMSGDDIRSIMWMDADGAGDGWRAGTQNGATVPIVGTDSANNATLDWQLLHYAVDDGVSAAISRNGTLIESITPASVSLSTISAASFTVGAIYPISTTLSGDGSFFEGGIAEARLRFDVLSADWITTEYNNQSDNASFFTSANPEGGALSLDLAAGSLTVTGGVLDTLVSRNLALSGGVFSATGGDVTFQRGRTIDLLGGTYSLTGGDLSLLANRSLALGAGGFTLTGGDLDLVSGLQMTLESGSFSVTGNDLNLLTARQLGLSSGTYSVTGGGLGLTYTPNTGAFELNLEGGSFTLTGQALSLLNSRLLELSAGSVGVSGGELGLVNGYVLDVGSGTFLLTGQTLDLDRTRAITLEQGDIIITGGSIGLAYSGDVSSTIVMPHQIGLEDVQLEDVAQGELAFNLTTGKMWTVDHLLNINTVGGLYNGADLPKYDPEVSGAWWNDDGILKVSNG